MEGRTYDSRMLVGVMAVPMVTASLVLTFAAIAAPRIQGRPRTFSIVRKTMER